MKRTAGRTVLLMGAAMLGGFLATLGYRTITSAEPTSGPGRSPDDSSFTGAHAIATAEHDRTFDEENAALKKALDDSRAELARLLRDPKASDESILAVVEKSITAHNALERRVARHLIKVRHHLTAAQQQQLFERCAEKIDEVRGHRQYRWGAGGGRGRGGPGFGGGRRGP